jgi:oligopeptidase B
MITTLLNDAEAPPRAQQRPVLDTRHGITRRDDYAWLRDANWQEVMRDPSVLDPAILEYLEAENAYAARITTPLQALQDKLFNEMKGRLKENDSSVPVPDGCWSYFFRYVEGGQHRQFCREPRSGGDPRVLVDGNQLAADHSYFQLSDVYPSPDHTIAAYAVDTNGSEYYRIRFRDVASGTDLPDEIPDAEGSAIWSAAGGFLFYTKLDEHHRSRQVFRHEMGTPVLSDVLIYEEPDPGFRLGVGLTQSRRYIVIVSHASETSEVRVIDATKPREAPVLIAPRLAGEQYEIEHRGGDFIILTNAGGAEDFKIMTAPVASPGRENWREIEPHRHGRLILDITAYRDHLVRLELEHSLPRIVIRRFADGSEHEIAFAEEAYALSIPESYEFDTQTLRFRYSSMTTPEQVFDYDMESRKRVLRKMQEVPSGHNPANYVTRRLYAPAEDGEMVPISLLYRITTPLNGSAPVLLYGYGSYGITIPASFSTRELSLVDRGFIYAIAHVRGGKDRGYGWYQDGKREKKVNTFKDFITAAKYLAIIGLTRRGRIVAEGASAGGMLMGAAANMAPGLFSGIIANVPFVDCLNTMLDDTLPLTPPEWPEWGNPITSKADFETIAAYSPYDNVSAQHYPHMLVLAGLTDPRVTYWEPAKWVAKLRAMKTNESMLLFRTNMKAGHKGVSGRYDRLKEVALCQAFALLVSGMVEPA